MNKVIKDGKVAVLISYGYGAGFYSGGAPIEAIFDPKLVELVESEDFEKLKQQQSVQERFNASIEKLKEIFVSLVQPLLPVLDLFAMILKPVGILAGLIGQVAKFLGKITGGFLPFLLAYSTF